MALNIFALGFTALLARMIWGAREVPSIAAWPVLFLSDIPTIGGIAR